MPCMRQHHGLILALLLAVSIGCGDPTLVSPDTTITLGPADGEIVRNAEITFQWLGSTWVAEYSYQLDESEWSAWMQESSITFPGLDEGAHTFAVKGRYPSGVEDDSPAVRAFTVDAVKGPSLMIRPRQSQIRIGSDFTVELMAEEVADLMLVHLILNYDPSILSLVQIQTSWESSILAIHGGSIVSIEDTSKAGQIDISLGVGQSDPAGVDGSGPLVRVTFAAYQSGQAELSFGKMSELRDSRNRSIPLNETVNAIVLVQ